jgi:hypothetical protein
MKRAILFAAILLTAFLPVAADTPTDAPAPNPPITDPAQVATHYREVLAQPKYQETEEVDIDSRLKDSLSQWFLHLGAQLGKFQYSSEIPAFASLLMTLLVILSIAGLLYVIVRLTRRREEIEPTFVPGSPGPKTFRPPESYNDEIQQAIHNGNWHAAWLAGWRQFLSRLENRQLVEADRTRTNREYLTQLRAQTLPAPALDLLASMVDDYDRTIYGHKPIAEPDWIQFHRQIEEAALMLNLGEKTAQRPAQSIS